jgi:dihydrofolate reductase
MKKTIVVACSLNNVIGKDNQLIWHMPADLKFFKATTMGHYLLLGRKTFESMGGALPGRTSIVITSNKDYVVPEGHYVASSIEEGISIAASLNLAQLMILGGAQVYEQTIDIADEIILTEIKAEFDGDAFFPKIDSNKWELTWHEQHEKDQKNAYDYEFKKYLKKN